MDSQQQVLFDRIFSFVAERRAQDLVLSVGNPPMVTIDGRMQPVERESIMTPELLQSLAESVLTEEQKAVLTSEKNVTVAYDFSGKARFRLAFFMQEGSLSVVGRYIPAAIPSLGNLGLPEAILNIPNLPKGLVLLCGPQSSGKSTTAAAIFQAINQEQSRHIVTIEDPVEFLLVDQQSVIDQRQIGRDVNSQKDALEALHDQKCDVVFIDKLALENAEMILSVASSRLVIAVLEAESSRNAIEYMVNASSPEKVTAVRSELSKVLAGVFVQRLFPKTGGGLAVACEVLLPSASAQNVIRNGDLQQLTNVLQMSKSEGMQAMDAALDELVRKGETQEEDIKPYRSR